MRILTSCLLVTLLLSPTIVVASGSSSVVPAFSLMKRPDFPLERFASGKLGVVRPTWACSYLVVVYRYLAGLPPNSDQQRAFLSVWNKRLWRETGAIPVEPKLDIDESLNYWLVTRKKVQGAREIALGELSAFKDSPQGYFGFLNCTAGAFDKAAETLEDRITRFGAASHKVRDWLSAQDIVFDNCSSKTAAKIPPEAAPGDNQLIRFDRAYQIAAAYFYAGNFDEAAKAFDVIVSDSASPWRAWARLVLARILVRRAELQSPNADEQSALIARAVTELKEILNEESLTEVHDAATSLLHIICARRHDPAAAAFLAGGILRPAYLEDLAWDFNAYTFSPYSRHVISPSEAEDDMTMWIGAFAGTGDRNFAESRWKKDPSLPWLVATLANARAEDPSLPEVLAEAAKVGFDSRAWPTVTFYRLSLEPSRDKARRELDTLLPRIRQSLPPTSQNLFAELRLSLAADLDDLLRHAQRIPVAVGDQESNEMGDYSSGWEPLFDRDSALAFNGQLPLKLLVEAAKRTILPQRLRNEVARVAWVRAVLLDDHKTAGELARLIRSLPGAASREGLAKDLSAYLEAKTAPERDVAAALTIGRNPGLSCWVRGGFLRNGSPEEMGRPHTNWWSLDGIAGIPREDSTQHPLPFLDEEQRVTAQTEYQKLLSLGNAPSCLGRLAMNAVEALPNHPRVPELLHRVVLASSQGRGDAQTGTWSKAAFTLLHSRFPKSIWTEKTPYWYR